MFSLNLNSKMSILVSLLVVSLLSLMAFFTLAYFEDQFKKSIYSQQFAMTSSVAGQIDDKIVTYQNELVQVARSISPELLVHRREAQKFIENRFDTVSMFDSGLFVFSPDGRVLAGSVRGLTEMGEGCHALDEIKKATKTQAPHISDPFFCLKADEHPIVMFTAPIRNANGEVIAVLAGNIDLMRDNFLGKLARAKIGESGYYYIVNEKRTLLLHHDRSRILTTLPVGRNKALDNAVRGFEGSEENVNSHGLPVVSTFKRLAATHWILSANYPLSEAYASLYDAKRTMLVALLSMVVVIVLAVWAAMRHMMAPLVVLTGHVKAIAGNEECPASVHINTHDEIEDLANAFNRLMGDVASHKKVLQEEKEFEKSLVQHSSLPTFVIDANHRVLHWNKASEGLTGIRASEILGTDDHWRGFYGSRRPTLADFVVDGAYEEADSLYPLCSKSTDGLHGEGWHLHLNGKDRYISFYAAPIYNSAGELVAAIEIVEDMTEQKRTEEELRKLSCAVEQSPNAVVITNTGGDIEYINPKFSLLTGYTREEVIGKNARILQSGETSPQYFRIMWETISSGLEWRGEFLNKKKNGELYWESASISPVKNENGVITHHVALKEDVTEQKLAGEALRTSVERYRSLVENIDLGISLIDNSHRIIMTNSAQGNMLHKPASELLYKECFREFKKRAERCPQCPGTLAMETGKPAVVQTEGTRDDGSRLVVKVSAFPVFDSEGKATQFIEVVQDITDHIQAEEQKKYLEDQLRQSQKFEAIGTLAGGIAHDFNNILTVITAYCSLMERKTAEDDPLRNYLGKILSATEKATSLTRSLLAYSRKQAIDPHPVELNEIIQKVRNLLARLLGEEIDLTVHLADEQLTIMADSLQIEQVLMNLATNAKDAMPRGGTLQIDTERLEMDAEFVKAHGYGTPGGYAVVIVSDTGKGIGEELQGRIFEPFFTTKEVGKGTGLGLSMAYGIIKQHNGYINVYSEPGKGSTFRIYLPVMDSGKNEIKQIDFPRPKSGQETILLVEDDKEIRASLKELLEQDGYTIVEAMDGEDGVEKFAEHREEVQLLLLDVIMPKKNGKEVYEEIRAMQPDIKAIFVSGYTADILTAKGVLQGDVNLIAKPIEINTLSAKIREVLEK